MVTRAGENYKTGEERVRWGRGLAIFVKVTRCAGHLPVVSWPHVCPFSSVQQLGSQDQPDPGPAGLLSGRVAGRPAGAEEAAGREQATFAPPAAGWGGRRLSVPVGSRRRSWAIVA